MTPAPRALDDLVPKYCWSVFGSRFAQGPTLRLATSEDDYVIVEIFVMEFATQEKLDAYFRILASLPARIQSPQAAENAKHFEQFAEKIAREKSRVGTSSRRFDCAKKLARAALSFIFQAANALSMPKPVRRAGRPGPAGNHEPDVAFQC